MIPLTKEQLRDNASANFRYARKQLNLTIKEMSEYLGIHEKTLGAIEQRGISTLIQVYKLSRLINVSIDTLYTTQLK